MSDDSPGRPTTPRSRIRRLPEKAVSDRSALDAVLDAGRVGHLAITDESGQPYVLPMAYARDGDRLLVHGSTGSRLMRGLAAGQPTCFTVTLLDGLVLARSVFESSMNYRSAMVLGACRALEGAEKEQALRVISDHLLPGRWADIRSPSSKELAATLVLALDLDEWSLKISAGGPSDAPGDETWPAWGGRVPVVTTFGDPEPDELAVGMPVPPYIEHWTIA